MTTTQVGDATFVLVACDPMLEWVPNRDSLRPGELPPLNIFQAIEAGLTFPVRSLLWKERLRCEREGVPWSMTRVMATKDIPALDMRMGNVALVSANRLFELRSYVKDGLLVKVESS